MIFIVLIIVGYFIFRYVRSKRKKNTVQPFPSDWEPYLKDKVDFYNNLDPNLQKVFKQRMMLFLSGVKIEAVQFDLTGEDQALLAASAIIPVFRFEEWHYSYLDTIILYPSHFNESLYFDQKSKNRNIAGMVGSGVYEGKMILSRKALHHGFQNKTDKRNTAIHEFIHLIDKEDGKIDGVPEFLLKHEYSIPWLDLIHKKMEAINEDKSDIREYGGTSQIEFFAVAAEYFFERPKLMKRKHPDLYAMLNSCFIKESV